MPFIARAAAISEPMNPPPMTANRSALLGQRSQPLVIVQGAEVDDLLAAEGQAPGGDAGGQEQLVEGVDGPLVIQ